MTQPIRSSLKKEKKRYGEFMRPLDVDLLPLSTEHRADPLVLRFIRFADATSRKEFISNPCDWSEEERDAYARGDTVAFSTLRGYSRGEIEEFLDFVKTAHEVDAKYGEDTANSLHYLIMQQTEHHTLSQ